MTSASTTTSTIYSATETPSSTDTGTIVTTIASVSAPLITNTIVASSSISETIDTNTLTTDVTLSTTTSTVSTSSTESSSSSSSSSETTDSSSASIDVNLYTTTSSALTISVPTDSTTQTTESSIYTTTSSVSSTVSGTSDSSTASIDVSLYTTTSAASSSSTSESSSSGTSSSVISSSSSTSGYTGDLFSVIDTAAPPSVFPRENLYLSLTDGVSNGDTPYETNKFYTNMMLDDQDDFVFVYPYAVWWLKDTYYGLGISHTTYSDYVFTYDDDSTTASSYSNPLDVESLVLSADSFDSSVTLDLTEMEHMSVLATLSESSSTTNFIDFPLVQGMGFVTGVYNGGLTPIINSAVGFSVITQEESDALASGILKYRATLYNEVDWLIYVTLPDGYTTSDFSFTTESSYELKGSASIDGLIIQVAVAPDSTQEAYYDEAAGMYPTAANVSGTVTDSTSAVYSLSYTTSGKSYSGSTMVFALAHHVDSLSSTTADLATGISLYSTTKGKMYGYLTTELIMEETLETDIQFLPWVANMTSDLSYTADQLQLIAAAANSELSVDIATTVASLDSNYYSGKVIDKYAYILLTVSEIIGSEDVTKQTLSAMKDAFAPFLNNTQYYPLMYDTLYKGVTSTASQSGDTDLDFGSGYYNDHHFHYGYFVHAAAIVGYVDAKYNGTWAEENKDWVNSLIRDVANPSSDDTYFPISRMFDWFHGHSWAAGLFSAADGKNEESSSEDYNFAYGMKLWGKVIGDNSMESRGDLMLAVMKRAMNKYFLYSDDNDVEPSPIIPNKVSGILFDNMIEHTTYFGSNTEYIQGIHMLPITPVSSLIRGAEFVKQEWDEVIASIIDSVDSGWTGILRLNEALYDATTSYSFFSSDNFTSTYLDDGQSLTWCLAFSAGIMNST
ncbi:hypothetical protein PACTADRAFT_39792 [Pachysolen tannophilus NRRL Y-2460]|uniref:glucan endo-1,3-beta-D-glucosidase n=1 Tax=Pachysolen tannophilus NRRL Y-2460 TaxID=669874 RepID=A0A1E4TY38_PACTA|nr:hypothetical protein PACTADRAFT_39792 [Pachysolen tannophilus NRRL Y-2460]